MKKKLDLVILAGGKGSRIKNYLNKYPKPLVKFNGLHFIDYILQNFLKFNFNNIVILSGYRGNKIKKIYEKKIYNLKKIKIFIEKSPMDTGGALFSIRKIVKNDFILTNGDSLMDLNIKKFLKKPIGKKLIRLGLIKSSFNKNSNKLNFLKVKKNNVIFSKNSNFINCGIYYCNKNLLNIIPNKKISLENEIIPSLIKKKLISGKYLFPSFFIDIGTPYYFKKASSILKNIFYKPAVFFDRDNTLIKDDGYTFKIEKLKFKNSAIQAINFLIKNQYYIFLVTNQAGIAKGYFKEKDFFKFQQFMNFKMKKNGAYFHDIEYCPYHPEAKVKKYKKKTELRKPGNKMIKNLENKWLIKKNKSFMIGDKISDMKVAKKSNIYFEFVKDNLLSQVKKIHKKLN